MRRAREDLGALGCTRDAYQLYWAATVIGVVSGLLGSGIAGAEGLPARGFELVAYLLHLGAAVLMVIAYAALAPRPAGPLPAALNKLLVVLALAMLVLSLLRLAPPDAERWVAARDFVTRHLLVWIVLAPVVLAAGSIPFLWRRGLRGPAVGWALWLLVNVLTFVVPAIQLDREQPQTGVLLYFGSLTLAYSGLLLTVPLWTALSLGRYVRGASKQIA